MRDANVRRSSQVLHLSSKKEDLLQQALDVTRLTSRPESLDNAGEDEDEHSVQPADGRIRPAADLLIESDDLERIFAVLARLGWREAKILRMRFGLDSYSPMTLAAIGNDLGLTRERVRQLEKSGIEQIVSTLGRHGPAMA